MHHAIEIVYRPVSRATPRICFDRFPSLSLFYARAHMTGYDKYREYDIARHTNRGPRDRDEGKGANYGGSDISEH